MADEGRSDVSRLLEKIQAGSEDARQRLFEIVYAELHHIAARYLAREHDGHTLQTTDLLHEACLRFLSPDALGKMKGRAYFFAAVARAMRQTLVDHQRKRDAAIRGGGWVRVPLDDTLAQFEERRIDLLDLHEAIEELSRLDARQAQVVDLHFFMGSTFAEVVDFLEVSLSVVEADWRKARAFLKGRLRKEI